MLCAIEPKPTQGVCSALPWRIFRLHTLASPKRGAPQGQARRKQIKRQHHGLWDAKLRRHDPLKLLEESMRGRVPALVPLKYERMLASPFGFFRGAVPVMAADLALLPNTGIVSQICGDAHVRNLGAFAAPDGRLVFDINDFDETTRAPFEWDLKRLAASLVLAGREAGAKDGFVEGCRARIRGAIPEIRAHLCRTSGAGAGALPGPSADEGGAGCATC